ncbi:regulatory protein RecX [Candidatus Saccharibacteria bacterium]|nr:regulatory protein RecX [Candidatus Saccharibacteria bacterium]
MKITAIKHQVKNLDRVSVFVDGKYGFSLSLDELLSQQIKNNDDIDGVHLKKLKKLSEDGKLRARALEWLFGRPHSIKEFKDYMWRKKADSELTEKLILEFTHKKYLDDIGFGVWLVEMRQRSGKSNRQIKSELFSKGLSKEDADAVLEGQPETEQDRLKNLINKKSKIPRYRDDSAKLAKYLVGQGFSWGDVKQALALREFED